MKYINVDLLRVVIKEHTLFYAGQANLLDGTNALDGYDEVLAIIDSLQQEQPEDIVVIAKTFLDALSKTPYNNKPITDAQTIVKQLLLFFENPKEYNPDAILEQPEVDLDKETIIEYVHNNYHYDKDFDGYGHSNLRPVFTREDLIELAHHFFNLGLNARK